jgi:ribosomal protein S18 acetylase RimI-like enzyme
MSSSLPPSPPTQLGVSQLPVSIRPARLADAAELADVLASSFYSRQGWGRWLYPLLRLGIHEDVKSRLRSRGEDYVCFIAVAVPASAGPAVASASPRLLGTAEISLRPSLPTGLPWSVAWPMMRSRQPYISNLAVRPDCRRQGIAGQLLAACEQTARMWRCQTLYLHVMDDNAAARRLYSRGGYQLHRTEPHLQTWFWQPPKRLLLRKSLTASTRFSGS